MSTQTYYSQCGLSRQQCLVTVVHHSANALHKDMTTTTNIFMVHTVATHNFLFTLLLQYKPFSIEDHQVLSLFMTTLNLPCRVFVNLKERRSVTSLEKK